MNQPKIQPPDTEPTLTLYREDVDARTVGILSSWVEKWGGLYWELLGAYLEHDDVPLVAVRHPMTASALAQMGVLQREGDMQFVDRHVLASLIAEQKKRGCLYTYYRLNGGTIQDVLASMPMRSARIPHWQEPEQEGEE